MLAALVGAALAAFVGYAVAGEVVPAPGGAYIEAAIGAPRYLNPLLAAPGTPDDDLVALVFDGLTTVDPDGQVRPDLAAEWRISTDGREYVFRLRGDARWHDGRPVVAADVVDTIRAIQAPDFPGDPALVAQWRGIAADASGSDVRFTLPAPNAWFPEQASLGVIPSHVFAGARGRALLDHDANARPIGSGAYRVVSADLRRVELTWHEEHHDRAPYVRTIVMRFFSSLDAALGALRRGEANALRPVLAGDLTAATPPGFARAEAREHGRRATLLFNTRAAPFDDVARRRLVAAAASTPTAALGGLRFTVVTNADPARVRLAEELARRLNGVGGQVDVQSIGWSGMIADVLQAGRFQAALVEQSDGLRDGDPTPFWGAGAALNFGRWRDERAEAALARARESRSAPVRRDAIRDWHVIFDAESPGLVLESPRIASWISTDLRGATLADVAALRDRFARVGDWYVFTRRAPGRF